MVNRDANFNKSECNQEEKKAEQVFSYNIKFFTYVHMTKIKYELDITSKKPKTCL